MINKMKLQSRTLVKDPLFQKSQKNIKNHHQQRLRDIYSHKKAAIKNDEHKKFSKQLRQSKEASHRIDQKFDPTINQKKAFIQHMIKINYRENEHAKSMSLLNMYRSTKQQQKKRIMEENQRIVAKIKGRKPEVPTYSELKKDSLIYEGRKSRLIKANSQTLI